MASSHSLRTLNVHVSWPALARRLELPWTGEAFPSTSRCPSCHQEKLTLYQDTIAGGNWHYCSSCQQRGDSIELAAAAWQLSLPDTITRLQQEGLLLTGEDLGEARASCYLRDYPGSRQLLESFWEEAQSYFSRSPSRGLNRLKTLFHLQSPAARPRWQEGPGRLVGGLPVRRIHELLRRKENPRGLPTNIEEVLVIPYCDLPGRICGFLFVSRNGGPGDRLYFRPGLSNQGGGAGSKVREAGLAGPWDGYGFGRHLFAVEDPLLMLRLQVRHATVSTRLLPLVAWHDRLDLLTQNAWLATGCVPIIWCWQLNPRALHQAIRNDCLLATAGPDRLTPERIRCYLKLTSAADLLRRVQRVAQPWRHALKLWGKLAGKEKLLGLIDELHRYGHDPVAVAREVGLHYSKEIDLHGTPARSVRYGPYTIYETQEGWSYQKGSKRQNALPAQVVNAVLRINRVDEVYGRLCYHGDITINNQKVPFDVPCETLDHNPAGWLKYLLFQEGAGVLHVCPGWPKKLVEIAMLFKEPRLNKPV